MTSKNNPLLGINITLDPGHGDTKAYDDFRIGPTGEREEWINLRVAKQLAKKLSKAGANVILTRQSDTDVSLGGRAVLAKRHQSHLLVSIHHNGSLNDPGIDLPIVYFFGEASLNPASVDFARILLRKMEESMAFEQAGSGAVYSDHLIYGSGTSILRNTISQMPGVIGEGGFFTNTNGETRLKSSAYNKLEAEVYYQAILEYFSHGFPSATHRQADSTQYIDLDRALDFQLDDGLNGTLFDENSFLVTQDDDTIQFSWNAQSGVLSLQPEQSENNAVTFQVYGRNSKGNALHPVRFVFRTEAGYKWNAYGKWSDAFAKAEDIYAEIDSSNEAPDDDRLESINESLHLYQLSLELQVVHPKARVAEEKTLDLLKLKQHYSEVDLSSEIEAQAKKILDFYPD